MWDQGRGGLADRGGVGVDTQDGERVDQTPKMRFGAKNASVQDERRVEDAVAKQEAAVAEVERRAAVWENRAVKPQHDRALAAFRRRGSAQAATRASDKPPRSPKIAQ
jgi:hypothetical protein